MVDYKVTVSTDHLNIIGTLNRVNIKLVGTDGQSDCKGIIIFKMPLTFTSGPVSSFTVSCPDSIGKLLFIELDKPDLLVYLKDSWFPAKVEVKSPEGDTYMFPIYRWITDNKVHRFREATALRICEDNDELCKNMREEELKQQEEDYRWHVYEEGMPHCMKAKDISSLPSEERFSFIKNMELLFTQVLGQIQLRFEGLAGSKENWSKIDDIKQVMPSRWTEISDYVEQHWREDAFFGYQYLNGINPMMIRRCSALPENFPVTDNMVFPGGQCTLEDEMMHGNIFLCDYKILDGLKANIINEKQQYLMAPLVLLHKKPEDKLMPIAIQLKQTPSEDNPIFFPTDSEYDWLMAKIFVRSADFNEHQMNSHLLRTHLLAEVFAVSLLRNLPAVHPLYKLLVPHTRDTLGINLLARKSLISETGVFTNFAASGGEDMSTLLKKSLSSVTYSSLCIPEDIAERGLKAVPNFYYRDDGLKLWDIIHRFVKGMLSFFYKDDADIQKDSELQKWVSDIFVKGFLSQDGTGIPQTLTTVEELVKFVTMVIFTCSGQHSAVNNGQYDYGGWMPNAPSTLKLPPPTTKGTTSEATMLETLPDQGTTAKGMAAIWLLSHPSSDYVPLGQYLENHFGEKTPCQLIRVFQLELEVLSANINLRNVNLEVPYTYMDPKAIENSVAI
ncbi:hydroperoxide isomerase ALOXE3-like [Cottoperca gobio]|uniref:Hydroperoxide isomerase ALOXE3-like n=1 Tax=Cottoperca gobio TaxID=56716 RepID=A0A6J2QI24_COTGO|nr:hydroperoxide isomerase ALOXE3-like [Cottoperca gobio]